MQDMLVRLYNLPDGSPLRTAAAEQGITVRTCNPFEAHILEDWVGRHFSARWVSECRIAMSHSPIGCVIATRDREILGFACYDATARGFVGPMGVSESARGCGVGRVLLVTALEHMRTLGYGYAIIGGVGPADFYARCVGATPIADSSPGIYADILPNPPASTQK